MIESLPNIKMFDRRYSVYDTESATAVEMVANLAGKMNEVIQEYNKLEKSVSDTVSNYKELSDQERKVFTTSLRQEFQDFIDVVSMKLAVISDQMNVRKIDLTCFDSEGKIVEECAGGTKTTYTLEFDEEGNPIKIKDSNGNETVLEW